MLYKTMIYLSKNLPVAHIYTDTWIDYINNWRWLSLIIRNNAKLRIIMWYKSYVSMVVDPLSGHQAIGTATRPWTRPLVVDPPLGNQAIGTATNCGSNH